MITPSSTPMLTAAMRGRVANLSHTVNPSKTLILAYATSVLLSDDPALSWFGCNMISPQ